MRKRCVMAVGIVFGAAALHADPLPFAISVTPAAESASGTVSLKDIAEQTVHQWTGQAPADKTVGRLQELFEENWRKGALPLCPAKLQEIQKQALLKKALAKWVAHYSRDASIKSDRLEALKGLIRSMQFVMQLSTPKLVARDAASAEFQKDSQWCGRADGSTCVAGPIFRLVPTTLPPAADLYGQIENRLEPVKPGDERQFHVVSYEILWDPPLTRVRYSVSFYVEENPASSPTIDLLGYDLLYAHEATPAPVTAAPAAAVPEISAAPTRFLRLKKTYGALNFLVTYPIGIVIGVKNAAFEIAKMPLSFVAGFLGRGHPYEYPLRNLQSAKAALVLEIVHPQKVNLLQGLSRLLGETPLVGPVFQVNDNPDRISRGGSQRIFLTRGIYGGGRMEQDTGLWLAATHAFYPEAGVSAVPYEFGTVTDVVWSMFNLSHGQAYVLADRIMESATRQDRLYLVGHSAGVQRITIASRLLGLRGYDVRQMMGIAGPSLGQANVNMLGPAPFKLLLNPEGDIVSVVGVGARGIATLADFGIRRPVKLLGDVALRWDRDRMRRWDRLLNRMGVSDAATENVIPGPTAQHETPMRFSLTDRIVYDQFIRTEYMDAFRDDLEPALKSKADAIPYRK